MSPKHISKLASLTKMFSCAAFIVLGFSVIFSCIISSVIADCCGGVDCFGRNHGAGWCTSTAQRQDFRCCGVGSCNIFCCNCDDGCIQFDHCPDTPAAGKRELPWTDIQHSTPSLTCPIAVTNSDCVQTLFDLLDSNGDGRITIDELIAGWALVSPTFDESLWEIPETYLVAVEYFDKFDTNHDGALDLAECEQQL
ncbi:hypothetical protein EDD36DRAFT_433894, partial [Exophiala viscosa]